MCTPHVRISKTMFNRVLAFLESAQGVLNPKDDKGALDVDAFEALLNIQSAIIHLEMTREDNYFESGSIFSGSSKLSDQVIITQRVDYSEKSELPAEVSPELAIS